MSFLQTWETSGDIISTSEKNLRRKLVLGGYMLYHDCKKRMNRGPSELSFSDVWLMSKKARRHRHHFFANCSNLQRNTLVLVNHVRGIDPIRVDEHVSNLEIEL